MGGNNNENMAKIGSRWKWKYLSNISSYSGVFQREIGTGIKAQCKIDELKITPTRNRNFLNFAIRSFRRIETIKMFLILEGSVYSRKYGQKCCWH